MISLRLEGLGARVECCSEGRPMIVVDGMA